MKKILILLLVVTFGLCLFTNCNGEPEDDTTPPTLTDFTLVSENPTNLPFIEFTLEGSDNVGITGWLLTEDSTTPDSGDSNWLEQKPTFTRVNGDGEVTVYAWAKDSAGNVSDSLALSLTHNLQPIIEDTTYWNKMIDYDYGVSGYDEGWTIKTDGNRNVYAVGYGSNLVSGSSNFDWWIKKFDIYGNEDTDNWDLKIDGGNNGFDMAYNLMIDDEGNVYVVGYIGVSSTDTAWMVKKFDSDGNEDSNWDMTFNGGDDGDDGQKEDSAFDIAMDNQGNIYIVGPGWNIFDASSEVDWWIKKFDSDGNEITSGWDKGIDDGSTTGDEQPFGGVEIDSQDNVYVAGVGMDLVDGSSNQDWWIKKFDADGNEITSGWDKKISSTGGSQMDRLFLLKVDENDNIWVGGGGREVAGTGTSDDWWLKKFDADGNELLEITEDGNSGGDYVRGIALCDNGNFFVLGYGMDLVEADSGADWWIRKYDSNGDYAGWEAQFKGGIGGNGIDEDLQSYMRSDDYVYSLTIDENGDIYAQGQGIELVGEGSHYDWWIKKWAVNE
jgi:hypothetical protein